MYYKMSVAGLERELPLCKIGEDLSIAAFVIFGDGSANGRLCL